MSALPQRTILPQFFPLFSSSIIGAADDGASAVLANGDGDAGRGEVKSEGVIRDGAGGGGSGAAGREKSLEISGGVNGFGAGPVPPVCFKASISDCIVRKVISGGGGAVGRFGDAGGNPAGC